MHIPLLLISENPRKLCECDGCIDVFEDECLRNEEPCFCHTTNNKHNKYHKKLANKVKIKLDEETFVIVSNLRNL